jgi:hypothetical protein
VSPGPGNDHGALRQESAATLVTTNATSVMQDADDHPALLADAAHAYLDVFFWEQAIRRAAAEGWHFSADELQVRYQLPDVSQACGGIFMRLHRAGVIRRVGYRPSSRRSRAGGIVAIWCGTGRSR